MKMDGSQSFSTPFQEVLYQHFQAKSKREYIDPILASQVAEGLHVIPEDESELLRNIRWYHISAIEEECQFQRPESALLSILLSLMRLVESHCIIARETILSRSSDSIEEFVDEYNTRWLSFSSLIVGFEDDIGFIEVAINKTYEG